MGYGDQPYVVFLHEDIDRKHLHIVTSRVKIDGKMISDRYEYHRSERIRESLEKKHGLIPARGSKAKEWELKKLDYPRGNVKAQISSVVRNALERYSFESVQGLNALLNIYNVEVEERKGTVERNGKDYRGIVFWPLDKDGKRAGNYIKASSIGTDAGVQTIDKAIADGTDKVKDLETRKHVEQRIDRVIERAGAEGALSRAEISVRLEQAGISPIFRINEQGRLTGATFIDHHERGVFNGSRVKFPANYWHELFEQHPDPEPSHQPDERQVPVPEPIPHTPEPDIPRPNDMPVPEPDDQQEEQPDDGEYENADDDMPAYRRRPSSGHNHSSNADDWRYWQGFGIMEGFIDQGPVYEEIDPQFRQLRKKKKKKKRPRR